MPFHNYSPKTARSLFKSNPAPSVLSPQSASRITKPQTPDRQQSSFSKSIKENLERTRALLASINKEKYDKDLELSRMDEKAAARARLEAAQRAALDDELREDALLELKKQQTPLVIEDLRRELVPQIRAELLAQLKKDLRPKVHAELRSELVEEVTQALHIELREDEELRGVAIDELKDELHDEVVAQLKDELFPQVMAELKEEYKFMAEEQARGELAAGEADSGLPNGHLIANLDPALRAESEASDIIHAPSELAVIAKRRFSDAFQGEDPETRQKRLRMINSEKERHTKADSLPPYGSFAMFRDLDMRPVDDSLEEGETADVEDEANYRVMQAIEAEHLNEEVDELQPLNVPDDIYAEAGDEMSQPDEADEEHKNAEMLSGAAKSKMTAQTQASEPIETKAVVKEEDVLPASSLPETRKLNSSQSKRAAPPPQPTRVLRSAGKVPEPINELKDSTPKSRKGAAGKRTSQRVNPEKQTLDELHEGSENKTPDKAEKHTPTETQYRAAEPDSSALSELEDPGLKSTSPDEQEPGNEEAVANEGGVDVDNAKSASLRNGLKESTPQNDQSNNDLGFPPSNNRNSQSISSEVEEVNSENAHRELQNDSRKSNASSSQDSDLDQIHPSSDHPTHSQRQIPETESEASSRTTTATATSSRSIDEDEDEGPSQDNSHAKRLKDRLHYGLDDDDDQDEDETEDDQSDRNSDSESEHEHEHGSDSGSDDDGGDDDDSMEETDAEYDAEEYAQYAQYLPQQQQQQQDSMVPESIYSQAGGNQDEPIELD